MDVNEWNQQHRGKAIEGPDGRVFEMIECIGTAAYGRRIKCRDVRNGGRVLLLGPLRNLDLPEARKLIMAMTEPRVEKRLSDPQEVEVRLRKLAWKVMADGVSLLRHCTMPIECIVLRALVIVAPIWMVWHFGPGIIDSFSIMIERLFGGH